jgi:hypothetical protein
MNPCIEPNNYLEGSFLPKSVYRDLRQINLSLNAEYGILGKNFKCKHLTIGVLYTTN